MLSVKPNNSLLLLGRNSQIPKFLRNWANSYMLSLRLLVCSDKLYFIYKYYLYNQTHHFTTKLNLFSKGLPYAGYNHLTMLLVSMLLEKQSVQAGVEAQSWERGVEKDVEKTKPDKMSSLEFRSSTFVQDWLHAHIIMS